MTTTNPSSVTLAPLAPSRLRPLPETLLRTLDQIGRDFRARGLRVFVFGSVARSWPQAHATADLDLAFDWEPDVLRRPEVERELEHRVAELPTVRPVDLVNLADCSVNFRKQATTTTVLLGNE